MSTIDGGHPLNTLSVSHTAPAPDGYPKTAPITLSLWPEGGAGMELRPSKPIGLMAAQIGPIGVYGADPTGGQNKADILKADGLTTAQGDHRRAALKSHRFFQSGDGADNILMDRKPWIHIAPVAVFQRQSHRMLAELTFSRM